MRRRRSNPWPAFADLFSALLLATFAGWMAMAGTETKNVVEKQKNVIEEQAGRKVLQELAAKLADSGIGTQRSDSGPLGAARSCSPDICIDAELTFVSNQDTVRNDQRMRLLESCEKLKTQLDSLSDEERKKIRILVEGHTDSTLAAGLSGTAAFRTNWNLSAKRATSVMYVLSECGLKAPDYRVAAIGYADTEPLCEEATDDCNARNRRTTFRLSRISDDRIRQQSAAALSP